MLTEDILHDLQKKYRLSERIHKANLRYQRFLIYWFMLKGQQCYLHQNKKRKSLRKGGILWIIPLRFQI